MKNRQDKLDTNYQNFESNISKKIKTEDDYIKTSHFNNPKTLEALPLNTQLHILSFLETEEDFEEEISEINFIKFYQAIMAQHNIKKIIQPQEKYKNSPDSNLNNLNLRLKINSPKNFASLIFNNFHDKNIENSYILEKFFQKLSGKEVEEKAEFCPKIDFIQFQTKFKNINLSFLDKENEQGYNNIEPQDIVDIKEITKLFNHSKFYLNLAESVIKSDITDEIRKIIETTSNLKGISFNSCKMKKNALSSLLLPKEFKNLEYLDLGCNKISNNDASIIAEFLKSNKHLKSLDLSLTNLESNSLAKILDALKNHNNFKEIEIESIKEENLNDEELSKIIDIIKNNQNLENINLSNNGINLKNIKLILENAPTSLKSINIVEDTMQNIENNAEELVSTQNIEEELASILRKTSCNIDICDIFYKQDKQDIINKAIKEREEEKLLLPDNIPSNDIYSPLSAEQILENKMQFTK